MKRFLLLLVTIGAATAWFFRHVYPYRIVTSHVLVELPRQHANLNGTTIAFVSDTHVGPHFDAEHLHPVRDALRRSPTDLVILGGDYISESPRFIAKAAVALGEIAATARLGAYGILGNHDCSNRPDRVLEALQAQGVEMLVNESREVQTLNGSLWVVGIDDALLGRPDLGKSFKDVPPDAASICLWHVPDLIERAADYGPFLQLSGHTHGGQVRLPKIGPLSLPELGVAYPAGRYQIQDTELYVSRGIGMYRPPIRFNCAPELVIITLIAPA